MGGFGSGRKPGKACIDDMRPLDVRRLAREGYLKAGMDYVMQWMQRGEVRASIRVTVQTDRVWLGYRQRVNGAWQDMLYSVALDRTACHFGGQRVWWRCPAVGCGRRVAILYGGEVFVCRHCHKLAYRSQREADADRMLRRANTLRDRLQWEPGILNGEGGKPKGMHWRTFERLRFEHGERVTQALASMAQRLKLHDSRRAGVL